MHGISSIAEGVGGCDESRRGKSGLGVGILGPAEEEDVGLGAVKLVVDPAARLLDTDGSPFLDGMRVTLSLRSLPRGSLL